MTKREIKTLVTEFENGKKGYVLDFNHATLEDFIFESIGIDIAEEPYIPQSMAKTLTQVLTNESDKLTTKLIDDLRKH